MTAHRSAAPITNAATDAGMSTIVKVSKVRDGDDALILAADGVLSMFSVGVNPTDYHYDDDGVLVVDAGEWHHTALLPFGAFAAATVTDVAASQPTNLENPTMTDTLDTASPAADLEAAQPDPRPAIVPISTTARPSPPLTLQRVAELAAGAYRGDIPRAQIEAALANAITGDVAGIVQPAYRGEILSVIDHGTPLLNALNQAPLPASGLSIEYPMWDSTAPNGGLPTTGIQATEKTQIVSTPVKMVMKSVPVVTIAGGNDISLQAIERSSPSFLEAYFRAAAADWARKASAYAIDKLDDAAVVATPGSAFLENIANLLAALDPNVTPAGPLFVAMSHDVALPMISVPAT